MSLKVKICEKLIFLILRSKCFLTNPCYDSLHLGVFSSFQIVVWPRGDTCSLNRDSSGPCGSYEFLTHIRTQDGYCQKSRKKSDFPCTLAPKPGDSRGVGGRLRNSEDSLKSLHGVYKVFRSDFVKFEFQLIFGAFFSVNWLELASISPEVKICEKLIFLILRSKCFLSNPCYDSLRLGLI